VKKAVVIKTNGTTETIEMGPSNELSVLQESVGGWIQAIQLSDTLVMWLNEEGKMESLPHNAIAQWYWDMAFGPETDYIVGNVVFTGGVDNEGETIGLTEEQVATLSDTSNLVSN